MRQKYFFYPFGTSGDQTVVPDPTQSSGSVSFQSGWPYNYQRQIGTDPLALPIDRSTMNYLITTITEQLQQYQQFGLPEWIDTTDNDGTPFAYDFGACVRYSSTGNPPFTTYVSMVDGQGTNSSTPGADANWQPLRIIPGHYYTDTGAANAYVVAVDPPVTRYPNGLEISFKAVHANTGACTLNAGGGAIALNNNAGAALVSGDISAGSIVSAVYDAATTTFWCIGPVTSQLPPGRLLNIQVFTANGTYTPTTGTKSIVVEVQGAGGGSGGIQSLPAGWYGASGSGGAGAYAKGRFLSGFSGAPVTVGAAGAGGANTGGAGGNGGTSSFGALVSAPGGGGATTIETSTFPSNSGIANGSSAPSGGNIFMSTGSVGSQVLFATAGFVNGFCQPTLSVFANGPGAGAMGIYTIPGAGAITGNAGQAGIVIVYEYA
jgi:hypothetical protein